METTKVKPFFVYDGKCRFCCMWVDYSRKVTGDRVRYESFQKVAGEFPNIPLNEFKRSVNGSIWKREQLGVYLPSVSLQIQ